MNTEDRAKPSQAEAALRKTVEDLKKKVDGEKGRGDMPVDPALGRPETDKRAVEERLPPDDDEN